MKKKKSRKIGKFVVIALIVLGVLVYFFVPPVNATMNNILKMFASGDFTVVRQFDDIAVHSSAVACVPANICECKSVWMVEGSYFIVVQRYGRGGSMLLYRKAVGA